MTRNEYRLLLALAASLLLHLLPLLAQLAQSVAPAPRTPPLSATLRPPPDVPLLPPPPLTLPEQPRPAATPPAPPAPKAAPAVQRAKPTPTPKTWTQAVGQHLQKLNERGLFYPPEAIARGLEGEVLVRIVISESGQVTAARVEQSSGHRLLDDAALSAVRSLRSLPADAPQEALLPVRFRLR